jgi:hypothetical protein
MGEYVDVELFYGFGEALVYHCFLDVVEYYEQFGRE